jgi:hypothetical protein
VAYQIILDAVAEAGINALPAWVRPAVDEAMAVLEEVPWNGEPTSRGNPDGEVRRWLFGPEGAGMLTCLIVEHDREVHVLTIQWAG